MANISQCAFITLEKIFDPHTVGLNSRTDSPGIIIHAWPKSPNNSQEYKAFEHTGQ